MQYDQFDPETMKPTELKIQFASIRIELKYVESEKQRLAQELIDLKNKPTKTPKWKMVLGAAMGILIALNSILVNVGTGLLGAQPPNTLGYLVLAVSGFIYAVGILITTFIVGGRTNE